MTFVIGMEDLTANAFVETLAEKNCRFLTYEEIESYGNRVADVLNRNGDCAKLILSRNNTRVMYNDYPKFFEEKIIDGKGGVYLRETVDADDLIRSFRGYLPLHLLLAFVDPHSSQILE